MKLYFKTKLPTKLKNEIIDLIEDNKLQTWSISTINNIKYLKHTGQWGKKGVIKLSIDSNSKFMISEVLKFTNVEEEVEDFEGYYLGRFCELIFVNFSNSFSSIEKK